ncbi:helix-turn-helix transcriptional regulator [Vibrio sp. UCD-FRSSP16_10]|uniref:helix-turn-helix transcriptional regulator n=1 Tax=unclassified Vibrio TaxID=2614977 RepID=UPI0008012D91|nr:MULTISPECIES: response regulator transcription factor [unclassified Vibrio]OBT16057.1 helix-turn-helix transcriptional regulator [Vibrio sp. UCD-FRSSP16_30]OBT21140.1 helix-turn-helix transcriptional regulator [Vibrio sp. UCD-FRSSP16_10]
MSTRNLLILAEKNLQTSLLEKQLSSCLDLNVLVYLPEEAISKSHSLVTDLVLIEHSYLCAMEGRCLLPDFDVLNWPLLVHDVPANLVDEDILRWKQLKGVLSKNALIKHINESIEYILNGGLWLPRPYMERLVSNYRCSDLSSEQQDSGLTSREQQILDLLAYGISNKQIASRLFLSESTVKSHIYKLYKKLNVHSRHDAVRYARMNDYSLTKS